MSRLLYVIGEPGAGKTTAMSKATARYDSAEAWDDGWVPRHLLFARTRLVATEIGRRRGAFSGTDALSMSIIDKAERYLEVQPDGPPIILAEGARLANARFLAHAVQHCDDVDLLHLDNPKAPWQRAYRAKQLGSKEQSRSWVQGRRTAAQNLAASPPPGVRVTVVTSTDEAADFIASAIQESNR